MGDTECLVSDYNAETLEDKMNEIMDYIGVPDLNIVYNTETIDLS